MKQVRLIATILAGVVLLVVAGCSPGPSPSPTEPASQFTATLEVEPTPVHVGDEISISGSGFTTGQAVDIVWQTLEGHFKLGEFQEFHEPYFTEVLRTLVTVKANTEGKIQYVYQIPEDYGGSHNISAYVQGEEVGRTRVEIRPQFEVTPLTGPVGTEITIRATGIGYRMWENGYSIAWDNKYLGGFNAVTSNGSAMVRLRASGSPGPRIIRIWGGSIFPYLNVQQGPLDYLLPEDFTFVVTDAAPVFTGWVDDWPERDYSDLEAYPGTIGTGGEHLEITPNTGIVGTPLTLHGTGFPPGSMVELHWEAMRGNRREGWNPMTTPLTSIPISTEGGFIHELTMPDDLGGYHAIVATVNGQRVADTRVIIQPSAVEFTPTSGPVGTEITLTLKGVGWTELDNTYAMTYDNAYIGYGCGFNSMGDVTIYIQAAGEPGWHIISLWPTVYQADGIPFWQYLTPWLDFYDNHPGLPLPAFHFAFEVTE